MYAPSGHTPQKRRPQLLAAISLLLVGAIAVGCSSSNDVGSKAGGGDNASAIPPGDYQAGSSADGGDATARLELGNPLCHATTLSCDPDGTGNRCEASGTPFSDTPPAAEDAGSYTFG